MAMAQGTARLIQGDEAHEINRRLRQKYLTKAAVDTFGAAWGTVDDVSIEITPARWRSWSNKALGELSRAAAPDLDPTEWWIEPNT